MFLFVAFKSFWFIFHLGKSSKLEAMSILKNIIRLGNGRGDRLEVVVVQSGRSLMLFVHGVFHLEKISKLEAKNIKTKAEFSLLNDMLDWLLE